VKKVEGENVTLNLTRWGRGGLFHSSIINLQSSIDQGPSSFFNRQPAFWSDGNRAGKSDKVIAYDCSR